MTHIKYGKYHRKMYWYILLRIGVTTIPVVGNSIFNKSFPKRKLVLEHKVRGGKKFVKKVLKPTMLTRSYDANQSVASFQIVP